MEISEKTSEKFCQISWNDHKVSSPRQNRKKIDPKTQYRKEISKRKMRDDKQDSWKRSGAMTSHHGCDEHSKNRTCPACFNEPSRAGGVYWFDKNAKRSYVKKVLEKRRKPFWYSEVVFEKVVDKDLGIVYDERPLPREKYWYENLPEEKPFLPVKPLRFWGEREKLVEV